MRLKNQVFTPKSDSVKVKYTAGIKQYIESSPK